jgi:hypothetical protein
MPLVPYCTNRFDEGLFGFYASSIDFKKKCELNHVTTLITQSFRENNKFSESKYGGLLVYSQMQIL